MHDWAINTSARPRTEAARQDPSSEQSRALPIALEDLEGRDRKDQLRRAAVEFRLAQELAHDHGRQDRLPGAQRRLHALDIGSPFAPEVRDERARIDRDQRRSARSSSRSIESFTLPRS